MADIILCSIESFQAALGFRIVALDVDHDPRGAGIVGHEHGGYAHQPNARISQFALQDGLDLFPDRFS